MSFPRSPNDAIFPSKRQVNKRLKNTGGLKRKKVNKLRKIEKKHRKKFNRTLKPGMMAGESEMIGGKNSLDRASSMLSKRVEKTTKDLKFKMGMIRL